MITVYVVKERSQRWQEYLRFGVREQLEIKDWVKRIDRVADIGPWDGQALDVLCVEMPPFELTIKNRVRLGSLRMQSNM